MGNTASSPREDLSTRHSPESAQDWRSLLSSTRLRSRTTGHPSGSENTRRHSNAYGSFRRQTSSHSIPADAEEGEGADEVVFEQEDISFANMEDLRMRDAPITHITATPLSRRASTMSRLGSRFLPDSVVRGLQSSGEETPAEGRAHRTGLPGRITRATERRISSAGGRLSLRETMRQRMAARSDDRRHSMRTPLPTDFSSDPGLLQDSTSISDFNNVSRTSLPLDTESQPEGSWRRRARYARHSLSAPLVQMFNRTPERDSPMSSGEPSNQSLRSVSANPSDHLLPPLSTMDHTLGLDQHGQDLLRTTSETDSPNVLTPSMSLNSGSTTPTTLRRFPHSLRSRGRIARNAPTGQPPLAQVLHLAASAIAAQLSGHGGSSISNMQPLAGNGFDGTIQSFVQTLQQAASAQARGNGENGGGNGEDDGHLPPVNFLRVFSFPNAENGSNQSNPQSNTRNNTPDNSRSGGSDRMDVDQNNDDRSVTLVLVGVRSMPHGDVGTGEDGGTANPSLDALLNLPFLPPSNLLRNGSSGALLRRSDNRTRFSSRRNSMSNFSSFPQQYDSQRHHRTRSNTNRSSTTDPMPMVTPQSTIPSVLSESPPGPIPPPSTPAEPFLSGQSTPNRRPSSASAMPPPNLPELAEAPSTPSTEAMEGLSAPDASHYRRRSDSEFARRPELSSGATRRNGVVEPDTNSNSAGGRSWLIYVVGTNVSPDHPAFTMPSLFTDNPSYEDMQLLSSLLGPVKPPVATQADVASSGGVYRLIVNESTLLAQPQSEGLAPITLNVGDRCLICLCDYEASEEVRRLNKCKHLYHRECIDEVSISSPFHLSFVPSN